MLAYLQWIFLLGRQKIINSIYTRIINKLIERWDV